MVILIQWGYLKENKMDKIKNEARTIGPERVIPGLDQRGSFDHLASLLKSKAHLSYDEL
jgi:hypothetical protein